MTLPARHLLTGLAGIALLAGCGDDKPKGAPEGDPALTGALGDQIMVDPELATQDRTGEGVSAGANRVELPPEQRSPEAIAAAKAEADKLAGGAVQSAPPAEAGDASTLLEQASAAARVSEATRSAGTDCAQRADYSMNWVNQLPDALKVYPRASVQEAAGTDADGCKLRVASFVTPVATDDVVNFYYSRVRKAGYDASHRMDGADHVIGGKKAGAAYIIYARKLDNGLTEVDLIASGN